MREEEEGIRWELEGKEESVWEKVFIYNVVYNYLLLYYVLVFIYDLFMICLNVFFGDVVLFLIGFFWCEFKYFFVFFDCFWVFLGNVWVWIGLLFFRMYVYFWNVLFIYCLYIKKSGIDSMRIIDGDGC